MIVAFTGHRPQKLGGYDSNNPLALKVKAATHSLLTELKPLKAISGMALGFDQWAAQICIDLGIPFVAAIPFKGQHLQWPRSSQVEYVRLMKLASEIVIVSEGGYSAQKMQIRNEWLCDNANTLIAAWDGTSGGTANCVRYAQLMGQTIHRIDPTKL